MQSNAPSPYNSGFSATGAPASGAPASGAPASQPFGGLPPGDAHSQRISMLSAFCGISALEAAALLRTADTQATAADAPTGVHAMPASMPASMCPAVPVGGVLGAATAVVPHVPHATSYAEFAAFLAQCTAAPAAAPAAAFFAFFVLFALIAAFFFNRSSTILNSGAYFSLNTS